MRGKESDVSADKTTSLSPCSFITTLTPLGSSYLHRECAACRASLVWQTAGETRHCHPRVPPGKASSQLHSVGLRDMHQAISPALATTNVCHPNWCSSHRKTCVGIARKYQVRSYWYWTYFSIM